VPELDPPLPFAAPDEGLTPDPSFWGAPPRRRAGRRPGIAERVAAAIPSRDARTAIAAVVTVLLITTLVVSYRASSPRGTPDATTATRSSSTRRPTPAAAAPRRVEVHVAGAVTRPGVVTLPSGSRVIDAIDTAGGALATANLDAINLAARLRDGQQILVPSAGSTSTAAPPTTSVPNPTPAPTG
jgi:competence protein ComEA